MSLNSFEHNNTEISSCVHSSRGTVLNVLDVAGTMEIKWPLDDVTNRVLQSLMYPNRYKKDDNRLVPDYPKIHRELAKKGVTLTLLWTGYFAKVAPAGKKPYMSTQFSNLHNRWAKIYRATMRIPHNPGDSLEVDCNIHAYAYFGGATRFLFPDDLKAGVAKNIRYETVIPRVYREMAEYYGTAIVSARVRHAKDKPNAEGFVMYAMTWILTAIRNNRFSH